MSCERAELGETFSGPACPCLVSDFHTRTELLTLLQLPLNHHARTGYFSCCWLGSQCRFLSPSLRLWLPKTLIVILLFGLAFKHSFISGTGCSQDTSSALEMWHISGSLWSGSSTKAVIPMCSKRACGMLLGCTALLYFNWWKKGTQSAFGTDLTPAASLLHIHEVNMWLYSHHIKEVKSRRLANYVSKRLMTWDTSRYLLSEVTEETFFKCKLEFLLVCVSKHVHRDNFGSKFWS